MHTLALAALLLPGLAGAATPGDAVRAVRLQAPLEIDGRLEEPAWDTAPAHDGFVQLFPDEGKAPSERTEVRVLYDDRNLYVGVSCRDSRPGEIRRPLGRRDVIPFSDKVAVFVDSSHDRRTGYVFEVNAAGVQFDELMYGDDQENADWDAVWEVATAAVRDGWSAEFRLPLSIFRFSAANGQAWGLAVRRVVARTREELVSINLKRGERGVVSHFADLTGLDGIEPVQDLSFSPYLASRLAVRPRYDDDTRPRPRVSDPSADLGLDVRASLGRGLSLQASLNPDFGQVEADQLVQNLSTFELIFPEKRPFFTQGLDLFQGPTPHNLPSPQQLFYSRRIGLDAPILGATKLTGRVSDTVQVGLLQAFVAGAAAPDGSTEDQPARGYRFAPAQPLHFGQAGSYPAIAPATRNFLAAVARWQPAASATFGLSATNALPIGPPCTTEQANGSGDRPSRCDVLAGSALALDWNLRSPGSIWFVRGQLSGSAYQGGEFTAQEDALGNPLARPVHRVLADGTVLRPGELGWGAFVGFGKNGGEPWRFDVDLEWETPELDLNAVGFQKTQNELRFRPIFRYVRPTGGGPFHSFAHLMGGDLRATSDGALRRRNATLFYADEFQLRTFQTFGCEVDLDLEADDVREIDQAGIAFGRPGAWSANCYLNGDQSRPVYYEVWAGAGRTLPLPTVRTVPFGWAGALVSVRPHSSVETRVSVGWEANAWPARWVETGSGGEQLFGELSAPILSVALRQLLHLTPRLTVQVYGQLFVASGRYGPYYTGSAAPGGRIRAAGLVPGGTPSEDPGFHRTDLALNALLRWDYRVGATAFLVYSRTASERGLLAGERPAHGLGPRGLGTGPTTDTVLLKWTWYWAA
jgi:uncharacterized protein DUF5916/cellulose/xylan binding protein with CBM9 domain